MNIGNIFADIQKKLGDTEMKLKRYVLTLKRFGEAVKKARKKRKLSQDKLAKKIGYTSGMVSRWEHGLKEPGYLAVKALQRTLKIKI